VYPNTGSCHRLAQQPITRLRANAAVLFRGTCSDRPKKRLRQRLTYLAGEGDQSVQFRPTILCNFTPPLTTGDT
jgi:hypothetical protein